MGASSGGHENHNILCAFCVHCFEVGQWASTFCFLTHARKFLCFVIMIHWSLKESTEHPARLSKILYVHDGENAIFVGW